MFLFTFLGACWLAVGTWLYLGRVRHSRCRVCWCPLAGEASLSRGRLIALWCLHSSCQSRAGKGGATDTRGACRQIIPFPVAAPFTTSCSTPTCFSLLSITDSPKRLHCRSLHVHELELCFFSLFRSSKSLATGSPVILRRP